MADLLEPTPRAQRAGFSAQRRINATTVNPNASPFGQNVGITANPNATPVGGRFRQSLPAWAPADPTTGMPSQSPITPRLNNLPMTNPNAVAQSNRSGAFGTGAQNLQQRRDLFDRMSKDTGNLDAYKGQAAALGVSPGGWEAAVRRLNMGAPAPTPAPTPAPAPAPAPAPTPAPAAAATNPAGPNPAPQPQAPPATQATPPASVEMPPGTVVQQDYSRQAPAPIGPPEPSILNQWVNMARTRMRENKDKKPAAPRAFDPEKNRRDMQSNDLAVREAAIREKQRQTETNMRNSPVAKFLRYLVDPGAEYRATSK